MKRTFTCCLLLLQVLLLNAQSGNEAILFGRVTDILSGEPIEFVTVFIDGTSIASETKADGGYVLNIPALERVTIKFSRIGYKETSTRIKPMAAGLRRKVDVALAPSEADVVVEERARIDDSFDSFLEVQRRRIADQLSFPAVENGSLIAYGSTTGIQNRSNIK